MATQDRQPDRDTPSQPTGTSGRRTEHDPNDNTDQRRDRDTTPRKRTSPGEDEDSLLGNRTSNR